MAEETKKVETTEEEKVNPVILIDNETGEEYTLEFDKDAVLFAEARGFDPDTVGTYPMTKIPELFFYAFRMHHKNVAREKTDKLLEGIGGIKNVSDEFLARLIHLYNLPVAGLFGKETENPRVTVKL